MSKKYRFETLAIHEGFGDFTFNPVMPPIYVSTTYKQPEPGVFVGRYDYGRTANPTRDLLEKTLTALENGKFGLAFSSGCSAITTLLHLFGSGDRIILGHDLYAGTYRLFRSVFLKFNLEYKLVKFSNPENLAKEITDNTKMVFFETPTNPLLDIIDIEAVAQICKNRGVLVCVDNTFATPYLQNPLDLGADLVVHSSTKYLGGHSDVIGGAIITNDQEIFTKLQFLQNAIGAVPSPFDCFLLLRSLKTLSIRMERHSENARKIADFLVSHPKVKQVRYPGLPSHPGHSIAKKQMRDFGGMMSFEIDANLDQIKHFLAHLKLFFIAESLGGVESLIEVPALMTHAYLSPEERAAVGITDGLVRLSVGIESYLDLIEDLQNSLDKIS
ncbi:MAG: PLP-dependent aspartate aminotransferase family protein [Deltaproteobacteria bacterium]|nr:PLP-dependent aspartate aminotransferase family protein [Deltaproteobacteria bacterium]MCX7953165.1 PLP-dependent aspartate aminotransferase family protein [Deltaproteobacteria bacterium]